MATTQSAPDAVSHYRRNEREYDTISSELTSVRERFESADRFSQKVMLWDATTYAVMSVQNDVSMLRRAFQAHVTADSWNDVRDACRGLNYGNNKFRYIRENFDTVFGSDGDRIIEEAVNGNLWDAIEFCVDDILGVSWIKAPFVFAMLGYKSVLCIDTNVAQMVSGAQSIAYKNKASYQGMMGNVLSQHSDLYSELSPFMVQWVLFDANRRDGVARHEEWFEHMLNESPFGSQSGLSDF